MCCIYSSPSHGALDVVRLPFVRFMMALWRTTLVVPLRMSSLHTNCMMVVADLLGAWARPESPWAP